MLRIYSYNPIVMERLIPLLALHIPAGSFTPGGSGMDRFEPLKALLDVHPDRSLFAVVEGYSMKNAGLLPGDIFIFDILKEAVDGNIVVAELDGEFTVKRLSLTPNTLSLVPENADYARIDIAPDRDFAIRGVVTKLVKNL